MDRNTCPYCGYSPAVSFLKKAFLDPTKTVQCRNCRRNIGISYWSIFLALPILGGTFFALRCTASNFQAYAVWFVGILIGILVYWKAAKIVEK
jgi:Na+-transporting NADH:ubiquinone oxidoreductase subunit NqrB